MELKRAAELSICSVLKEALPDLTFLPSRGGEDDVTIAWQLNHNYKIGDVLRPTNASLVHAIVVTAAGNSGSTEPSFSDVIGSAYEGLPGQPNYQTTASLAVAAAVDAGKPEMPFGVVSIDDGEKTLATEDTNFLEGVVAWVTRAGDTNIVTHSAEFKRVYDALVNIGSGYDILRRLMIHGIDVRGTSEFTDAERKAHGDTVSFTMGVTHRPGS